MILRGIETIIREERIGCTREPQVVSERFFAIVDCGEGVTIKLPIPKDMVQGLKDWSFEAAKIKISLLNNHNESSEKGKAQGRESQ